MPPVYDSLVGRDDVAALIPEDASRQIIQDLPKASVALSSFRMARMSRHQQRVPVLNFLPTAYWVGSDTGIKQTTEQQWANLYLDARELAVLVPIPEVVLDDADFDIWGEIRPRLAEAMGAKIDAAALFGSDKPAGWPDSIVEQAVAKGNALTIGDTLVGGRNDFGLDVSATMGLVEDDGFDVTGFWSRRRLRQQLRNLRDDVGQPLVPGGHRRRRLVALRRAHRLGPERLLEQRPRAHRGRPLRGHPRGAPGHQLPHLHRRRHQR